jgi:hypothetical protein
MEQDMCSTDQSEGLGKILTESLPLVKKQLDILKPEADKAVTAKNKELQNIEEGLEGRVPKVNVTLAGGYGSGGNRNNLGLPDKPELDRESSRGRLLALRRQLGGGRGIQASILTSGQGVTGQANTKRKSLLGV